MKLIGIDGAKLGHWVIATCDGPDAKPPAFELTDNLADVFQRAASGQAIVVIDVPIGILSGEPAAAGRACDREARKVVGPVRASSVFKCSQQRVVGVPESVRGISTKSRGLWEGVYLPVLRHSASNRIG